jgi:hypothetical protein
MSGLSLFNIKRALAQGGRFGSAEDGQIAMIFGLVAVVLVALAGGSLDLMRTYNARQKLSEVAALACQFASRPSVLQLARADAAIPSGGKSYAASVNAYIDSALSAQKMSWTPTYAFRSVQDGPAYVDLSLAVPTAFLKIVRIETLPISATSHCYDSPGSSSGNGDASVVASEGFEAKPTPSTAFINALSPNGTEKMFLSTPANGMGTNPIYTGASGTAWYSAGYCLETNPAGIINATVVEGRRAAELDCDNGSGSAGNSSISTRVKLAAGNYELRYFYRSRVSYPNYDPLYLCGSAASDLTWANDRSPVGGRVSDALRTNQINVYLDRTGDTFAAAPLHDTIDGTQKLAGANLIDMCVYGFNWIERSVRIRVTSSSYYWLSFAADGQNDSYGGQIDNIRLCIDTCRGTPQDNFPASWQAANNFGTNKILFQDSFDRPTYSQDPAIAFNRAKGGNLANSVGTSGTPQSGWPSQAASGWATGPYNQVNMWLQGAFQGSQYVSLQGWDGFSTGPDPLNRLISRKFLLAPGYYSISYSYISMIDYSGPSNIFGTDCTSAPRSGSLYPMSQTKASGRARYATNTADITRGTNVLGVFLAHGQLVSTLNPNTALGKAVTTPGGTQRTQRSETTCRFPFLPPPFQQCTTRTWEETTTLPSTTTQTTLGGQATYTNPDGTTSVTPTVQPDKVNWLNYDSTVNNPVIDTCGYVSGHNWWGRSPTVKITKPGWYWLTFSAQGDEVYGTGNGPAIDDVKLTALGSPYMLSPPSAVTIPTPGPAPDSRLSFGNDFYIIADPFVPPAPRQ